MERLGDINLLVTLLDEGYEVVFKRMGENKYAASVRVGGVQYVASYAEAETNPFNALHEAFLETPDFEEAEREWAEQIPF